MMDTLHGDIHEFPPKRGNPKSVNSAKKISQQCNHVGNPPR